MASAAAVLVIAAGCSGDSKRGGSDPVILACGDGVQQGGEACDDGNSVGGDGCSADCSSNEACGNGIVDAPRGEVCDDGNSVGGDGCSADCTSTESCGDGDVDPGEECDSGGVDGEDCDADCTRPVCGDLHTNTAAGETCDEGAESATCTASCTLSACGDGILNLTAGEVCDEGAETATCDADCTLVACGDLVVNATAGETCDDGNAVDGDGCLATCLLNVCGDGIVNPETEACDDGNVITELECPYGVPTCLLCDATCEEVLELIGPFCGDGIVTPGEEECDSRSAGACGACSAACDEVTLERATGSIAAEPGSSVDDGDTITIDDGVNPPVTFELDSDGVVSPGSVRVPFTSGSSAAAVARAIGNAINGANLDVSANVAGGNVMLEHNRPGAHGNVEISADGLTVTGFEGGEGADCGPGAACAQDADCQLGLVCGEDGTCEAG